MKAQKQFLWSLFHYWTQGAPQLWKHHHRWGFHIFFFLQFLTLNAELVKWSSIFIALIHCFVLQSFDWRSVFFSTFSRNLVQCLAPDRCSVSAEFQWINPLKEDLFHHSVKKKKKIPVLRFLSFQSALKFFGIPWKRIYCKWKFQWSLFPVSKLLDSLPNATIKDSIHAPHIKSLLYLHSVIKYLRCNYCGV